MSDAMSDGDIFHADGSGHSRRGSCPICVSTSRENYIDRKTWGHSELFRQRVRMRVDKLEREAKPKLDDLIYKAMNEVRMEMLREEHERVEALKGEGI